MKRFAFIGSLVLAVVVLVSSGSVLANTSTAFDSVDTPKVSKEKAREIALKRVPGKVVEEIVVEDEGKILFYTIVIRKNEKSTFDVMVSAENGEIVSVEEIKDDE